MTGEVWKPPLPIPAPGSADQAQPTLLGGPPTMDLATAAAFENERLREAHYSAIGQVAAAWSYFEAVAATWMVIFADIDPDVGVCFTAQILGSRGRIDGFIALVRHQGANQEWGDILDAFAKKVVKLSEKRNRAVHDVWDLTDATAPHRREMSASRFLRNVKIHQPTDDLLDLVDQIEALRAEFDSIAEKLFMEIYFPVAASPDTPPPGSGP